MKKILTITLLLIAINAQGQGLPVAANATLASLFPDENLRRVVARRLGNNVNLTGQALSNALAGIEGGLIIHKDTNNASGIEYLLKLTWLIVSETSIISLNVSSLTNLSYLYLSRNYGLGYLNISNLINLEFLYVQQNNLTNLDVSSLINLRVLDVSYNRLTSLDISKLINLEALIISNNSLTTLDISNNVNLHVIELGEFHSRPLRNEDIIGLNDNVTTLKWYRQ